MPQKRSSRGNLTFMSILIISKVGQLDLPGIISDASRASTELVIIGRPGAIKGPDTLFKQVLKFMDSDLALLFEVFPNESDPLLSHALMIVRRAFLLEESKKGLSASSLIELAVELKIRANNRKLRVLCL